MGQSRSKADLEYALMLTILNFHAEFMKSNCSHVQVEISDDVIDVILTRNGAVPAEVRLAQTDRGRALLQQVHEAMFMSCEEILKERIEPVVERKVREMATALDPVSGRSSITIRL
jgi:uncharacterized protein YbcI